MTYNVFSETLSLTQSVLRVCVCGGRRTRRQLTVGVGSPRATHGM